MGDAFVLSMTRKTLFGEAPVGRKAVLCAELREKKARSVKEPSYTYKLLYVKCVHACVHTCKHLYNMYIYIYTQTYAYINLSCASGTYPDGKGKEQPIGRREAACVYPPRGSEYPAQI